MTKVRITKWHDEGKLVCIEAYDENGKHVIDFVWDERDEQTPENLRKFDEWVFHMMKNKDLELIDDNV